MLKWYPDRVYAGRRTAKTGAATAICVLLFHLLGRGSPALACLGAVFSLRNDVGESIYFGIRRVLANLLGGVMAVLLIAIKQATGLSFTVDFLGILVFVILFIVFCNVFGISEGIVGGLAAFFIIYFNIVPSDSIAYALNRVLDTLIGAIIATLINFAFPPKKAIE